MLKYDPFRAPIIYVYNIHIYIYLHTQHNPCSPLHSRRAPAAANAKPLKHRPSARHFSSRPVAAADGYGQRRFQGFCFKGVLGIYRVCFGYMGVYGGI